MFLAGVFGSSTLAPTHPNEERDPPPEPTPIVFPSYEQHDLVTWSEPAALPNFQALFSRVLKPDDISDSHSHALNLEIIPECPLDSLVAQSFCRPDTEKNRSDLQERVNELMFENDLAFRALAKTLPRGAKGPRFAWMRKFWTGLESMSVYWDCSLDQYYEVDAVKRPRLDPEIAPDTETDGESAAAVNSQQVMCDAQSVQDTTEAGAVQSRRRYKGRRTNSGRDMPDAFRAETVRAFVEAAAFSYRCSVSAPRQMPVVHFDKLRLPVRQTAAVYRIPADLAKARQGRHEGPLMTVQCRADTSFVDEQGDRLVGKGRLDLLREVGGLLQIAQERRREGLSEVRPGEGKWWTTMPRWGGGTGEESKDNEENGDIVQLAEESIEAAKQKPGANSKSRKRKTPIAIWRELKCGSGVWDSRTDYKAIGRDHSSQYDEIFMVSSLNHHISILKLTVHAAYMDSVTNGTYPPTEPLEKDWSRPVIFRSRWYDLFNVDDRVEAFRGLWSVLAYLNRESEAQR